MVSLASNKEDNAPSPEGTLGNPPSPEATEGNPPSPEATADEKKRPGISGPFERETGLLATHRAGAQPARETEAA